MTRRALKQHDEVRRLMAGSDLVAADRACLALTTEHPTYGSGWLTASVISLRSQRAAEALERADFAARLMPADPLVLLQRCYCLAALRRRPEALAGAAQLIDSTQRTPALLDAVGSFFSVLGEQRQALAAYEAAIALAPDDPRFRFNRATVRRFLGDIDGAEQDYDDVIRRAPRDFEAYKNRTELRTQTPERNHVAELTGLLAGGIPDWRGEVHVRAALAKELEDLGRYAESFAALECWTRIRRQHLDYDVSVDVSTVDWVSEEFPAFLPGSVAGCDDPQPIFIVGLPRTGTTLVDRILSSHSQVYSAGELNHFAQAIVDAARRRTKLATVPRRELIRVAATLDFAALGRDYLERTRPATLAAPRFTDKMPLNYLYCGLIRRALPNARIIHVTRHPMAACYAIYKTQFKDGYPFSYSLDDLAQYYAGYRRLMAHWHATLPGAIFELRYEALVEDQLGESRRLLEHCGLDWEDACADFHRNPQATTTASAAQVRQPMYRSSLAQWRHYERELEPLREQLLALGIPVAEIDA